MRWPFFWKPIKYIKTFVWAPMVYTFFCSIIVRRLFFKFPIAPMKILTNFGDFTKSRNKFLFRLTKFFDVFDMATIKKKCIGNLPVFSKEGYGLRKPPVIVKINTVNSANCSVSHRWWSKIQKFWKRVTVLLFKITMAAWMPQQAFWRGFQ
jgi:hypothetical protein